MLGKVPAEAEYECFKGAVGEGAAAEFVGFMRIYRKLPNPDAILMNPDTPLTCRLTQRHCTPCPVPSLSVPVRATWNVL